MRDPSARLDRKAGQALKQGASDSDPTGGRKRPWAENPPGHGRHRLMPCSGRIGVRPSLDKGIGDAWTWRLHPRGRLRTNVPAFVVCMVELKDERNSHGSDRDGLATAGKSDQPFDWQGPLSQRSVSLRGQRNCPCVAPPPRHRLRSKGLIKRCRHCPDGVPENTSHHQRPRPQHAQLLP